MLKRNWLYILAGGILAVIREERSVEAASEEIHFAADSTDGQADDGSRSLKRIYAASIGAQLRYFGVMNGKD